MSKILLWSDPHIHLHKNQISRLNDCLEVVKWVFDTAISKNIKCIICAGDLFQDRQKIHVISYEKTFNLIKKYCKNHPDLKLYFLVGNHDMWFNERWDVSSISPLEAIENITVINQPCSLQVTEDCTMDFLPYTKNPLEDISNYFSKKKNDVLISHCSVDGAYLNNYVKAEISVEYEGDMVKVGMDTFTGWKRVFLGHYHCGQKLNDVVEYIGSPLELNFSEANQEKHIIILDTENLNTEYVINTFSPRHLIIREEEVKNHDLKNNFVQVIVEDITSTNIIDMKKNIKNSGFTTLEFKEKGKKRAVLTDKEKENIKNKLDISSGEILEKWMKAKGHGKLEFDKLLTIGQNIVRKAQ